MPVQWVNLVRWSVVSDIFVVKPIPAVPRRDSYNEYTFSAAFAVSSLLAF